MSLKTNVSARTLLLMMTHKQHNRCKPHVRETFQVNHLYNLLHKSSESTLIFLVGKLLHFQPVCNKSQKIRLAYEVLQSVFHDMSAVMLKKKTNTAIHNNEIRLEKKFPEIVSDNTVCKLLFLKFFPPKTNHFSLIPETPR